MDWYPLWNSLRIALISCAAVFFLGIFAAYYIAKLPRTVKGVLDGILTLPMVLPPTVVGYFLLLLFGAKRPLGLFILEHFGVKLVMNWYSAIFASIVVAFPLMYRTARGAFESFDETLAWSAQTLGQSNTWIFWRVRMPCCRQGILAGTVLAFARALGEYGATSMIAGYTPGRTATIATTVYQLWRTNDELGAMRWVLVDIVISAVVLLAVLVLNFAGTAAFTVLRTGERYIYDHAGAYETLGRSGFGSERMAACTRPAASMWALRPLVSLRSGYVSLATRPFLPSAALSAATASTELRLS